MEICQKHPGGAEVELSMLFVDVRGSTPLAERLGAAEFSRMMNKFYETATNVLIQTDAFIDKLVGDEVIGLYLPIFAGKEHAQKAVEAAGEMLRATGPMAIQAAPGSALAWAFTRGPRTWAPSRELRAA
jgi:adenylate cyclase